jgi:hypothetical protein
MKSTSSSAMCLTSAADKRQRHAKGWGKECQGCHERLRVQWKLNPDLSVKFKVFHWKVINWKVLL